VKILLRAVAIAMTVVTIGCSSGPDESSVGPVSVIADSRVTGDSVELRLTPPAGFTIVAADGDTSGTTGHYHVFVDRDPVAPGAVIPTEEGIIHSTDNPVVVDGLEPGMHRFVVVLGDGLHKRIGGSHGEITVEVVAA